MNRPFILIPLIILLGVSTAGQKAEASPEHEILALMQVTQDNWNEGNLEGYMASYWQSPRLRFAGGDQVSYGWESVLDRYKKSYPDPAAMGRLLFSDLEVEPMGQGHALVFGRWLLRYDHEPEKQPHGLFTLHVRLFAEGWRIVSDHTSSGQGTVSAATATITESDLLERVDQLCQRPWAGRLPGTTGYDEAAQAMADQFAALGLEPGGDDGFLQYMAIEANEILPGCEFAYTDAAGHLHQAQLDKDYLFRGFTGSGHLEAEVVFCGYGLSQPQRGYDDYAGIDVQGKVALVFKQGPPWQLADEKGWQGLPNPRPKAQTAVDHGAIAVLMVSRPLDQNPQPLINSVMHGSGSDGWAQEQVDIPQLQISHQVAASLLSGAQLELEEAQRRIDESQQPASTALNRQVRIKVDTRYNQAATTSNVVAILPGSDASLSGEHLVIGAHMDHVGTQSEEAFFPGANDNASGTAAVVEIAEAFVHGGVQPRRSVVFVLFTGEEQGLVGSKFYADNPALPLDKAAAMINMDCVAHGDSIQIWGGKTSPRLFDLTRDLDQAGNQLLVRRTGRGGGADAWPFHNQGLPTLYFTSKYSYTHLHRSTDTMATLNGPLYTSLTRLCYEVAAAIADGRYDREELQQ